MFSCKFCEISKNTFLTELLRVTASGCLKLTLVSYRSPRKLYFAIIWQKSSIWNWIKCFWNIKEISTTLMLFLNDVKTRCVIDVWLMCNRCVIDNSWLIHKSSRLPPEWFVHIKWFPRKSWNKKNSRNFITVKCNI